MVSSIRRIDAAVSAIAQIRTYTSRPLQYDMMNSSSVSRVVGALHSASENASAQASRDYKSYRKSTATVGETDSTATLAAGETESLRAKETATRLAQLKHSSVSQDIAALLQFSAPRQERQGYVAPTVRMEKGEIGVRELARLGVFGRKEESSRRIELAL